MYRKCGQQHGNRNTGHVIKVWCCKASQTRLGGESSQDDDYLEIIENSPIFILQHINMFNVMIMSCCYVSARSFMSSHFAVSCPCHLLTIIACLSCLPFLFGSLRCVALITLRLLLPTLRKKLRQLSSSSSNFEKEVSQSRNLKATE